MSSYFSNLTASSSISNVIGSRLNSLRRAITLGDEADDPDNEDCSHISNALRAYYNEKGRPFPPWLPPDPKAPAPNSRVVATSQPPGQAPGINYGRGGGLGDLWGDSGSPQPPASQTTSLRRGRGTPNVPPPLKSSVSSPAGPVPGSGMLGQAHSNPSSGSLHPAGARPLPSQRTGSSQSIQSRTNSGSGGSAQDRLRARLQGGRSPSPANLDPSVRKPIGERRW
ncbi:hypothetical protein N7456_006544 [Penicillium angulare]|uniref:Mso1 N-terminal domain-containing protein n=1 Tax=Penicillium angulare TaxID=116970 RepID=A0A9W9FIA5_9EURO|nr:hypothetical protein N7456_006544 [Penicillium angulare]